MSLTIGSPDTDEIPVRDEGPVHLRVSLGANLQLVVSDFAARGCLEQRLEPERHLPTAGIFSHGQSRVLKLDIGELGLARVKGAELHHIELELFVAEAAHAHVTDPPQSPEHFPPALQLHLQGLDELRQGEGWVSVKVGLSLERYFSAWDCKEEGNSDRKTVMKTLMN